MADGLDGTREHATPAMTKTDWRPKEKLCFPIKYLTHPMPVDHKASAPQRIGIYIFPLK
jgi:hypothetical protein